MGGLGILFVLGLYGLVALYALVKTPGWWRLATLAAVLLIPSADSLWAHYVTMPRVCKDAGLKIYKKADKAGGLRLSTADEAWVTKHGFPFVEGERVPGRYYRISRQGEQVIREEDVQPKARYLSDAKTVMVTRWIGGTMYRVVDLSTGDVIGRFVDFSYGGGWAERFLAAFTDAGPGPMFLISCNVEDFGRIGLLKALFDLGE
ncbi:MAG: hypothetical protein U5L03_00360 [Burkholderiaceae bacterium]|nr:hypothetical protein [Burkholderiaceae bacterium]